MNLNISQWILFVFFAVTSLLKASESPTNKENRVYCTSASKFFFIVNPPARRNFSSSPPSFMPKSVKDTLTGAAVGCAQGALVYPFDTISARLYGGLKLDHRLWRGYLAAVASRASKSSISFFGFSLADKLKGSRGSSKTLDPGIRTVVGSLPLVGLNVLSVLKYRRQTTETSYFSTLKRLSLRHSFAGVDGAFVKNIMVGGLGMHLFGKLRSKDDSTGMTLFKGGSCFGLLSLLFLPLEASRQLSMKDPVRYPLAFRAFPELLKQPSQVLRLSPTCVKAAIVGSLAAKGVHRILLGEEEALGGDEEALEFDTI